MRCTSGLFVAMFTLVSCASLRASQPGEPSKYDTICGENIRIRETCLASCSEAKEALKQTHAPDNYTYIFGSGAIGFDVAPNTPQLSYGSTWINKHVVEVDWSQVNRWDILRHELRHVRGENVP